MKQTIGERRLIMEKGKIILSGEGDYITLDPLSSGSMQREVMEIYLTSFPEEERREPEDMIARHKDCNSPLQILCIKRGEHPIGLISWWDFDDFAYIEHFAVAEEYRSSGIGSRALRMFADKIKKPTVVEVERPGMTPMADRRISFYHRLGFSGFATFDYIQPPYSEGLPAVPLMLMATGDILLPEKITRELHREVYGVRQNNIIKEK